MTKDNTQLAVIEKATALKIFTSPKGLDPILNEVRAILDAFEPDANTAKGRAEIVSMAYRVGRTKTHIDAVGKEETRILKEQPKLIDAERKRVRDILDTWACDVRAPVTEMEKEEEEIFREIHSYADLDIDHWESHMFAKIIEKLAEVDIDAIVIRRSQAIKAKESALFILKTSYDKSLQREELAKAQAELAAAEEAKRLAEEKLQQEKAAAEEADRKAAEAIEQQRVKAENEKRIAEEAVARESAAAEQRRVQEIAAVQEEKRQAEDKAENEKRAILAKAEQEKKSIQDEADRKVKEAEEKPSLLNEIKAIAATEAGALSHLSQEQTNQKSDQIAAVFARQELQKWAPEMFEFIQELTNVDGKYSYNSESTVFYDALKLLCKIEAGTQHGQTQEE